MNEYTCECCSITVPYNEITGHTNSNYEPVLVCYPCHDAWCHVKIDPDFGWTNPYICEKVIKTESKIKKKLRKTFGFMWG